MVKIIFWLIPFCTICLVQAMRVEPRPHPVQAAVAQGGVQDEPAADRVLAADAEDDEIVVGCDIVALGVLAFISGWSMTAGTVALLLAIKSGFTLAGFAITGYGACKLYQVLRRRYRGRHLTIHQIVGDIIHAYTGITDRRMRAFLNETEPLVERMEQLVIDLQRDGIELEQLTDEQRVLVAQLQQRLVALHALSGRLGLFNERRLNFIQRITRALDTLAIHMREIDVLIAAINRELDARGIGMPG